MARALGAVVLVVLGCLGHGLLVRQAVPSDEEPRLEDLSSFSEARALREVMGRLYFDQVRALHGGQDSCASGRRVHPLVANPANLHRLAVLQGEYLGTEFEGLSTAYRLGFLRRAEHWDRWLDVYVPLAYRRPTDRWVHELLPFARLVGDRAGRKGEVTRVEEFLQQLPPHLLTFRVEAPREPQPPVTRDAPDQP